jgi:predicted O-linked N-acetylglucosamine transferase (SPINDLY family)
MVANRDACALFDTPRFVRNLEAAYFDMWQGRDRRN